MEQAEVALEQLSLEERSGLPEGLAELAARGAYGDEEWSALPHSLLGDIFRRLLEQYTTVEEIVRAWQGLALVCKCWQQALHQSTPLCLELTRPGHLSAAARRWLCRVPMEVLLLARTMAPVPGADCQLLASEGFQEHSASVLRSLMHVSPDACPLLHNFSKLKQVALYCGSEADATRRIDAAVFHQLPKLSCLTIAGYWASLDTDQLPARLKHLALSNYNEGHSLEVTLPDGMKGMEMLSLRAAGVVLDWADCCQKCEEVHVAGDAVVLGVGVEPIPILIRDVGLDQLQTHMYRRMGKAMVDGERFVEASLAFFNLMLFSGPLERGVMPIDADDFLQTLRDDLLPIGIDVNPALEVHPDFVRDLPSPEACFVLELVKQEAGKPKSLHFTTPVTDAEVRLLTSQPVWRISWCEDPRAAQVLSDPAFQAQSGGTLTDLLSIPLVPELDLRPFTKLLSVLGVLHCSPTQLAPVLRRMPASLESLCLTAEGSQQPRDFDAGLVRHLRHLRELSLYAHRRHNLARLRRGVNMIRILNPVVEPGEVIGRGDNYCWPEYSAEGEEEESESEWEEVGEEEEAGSEASIDSFDSAVSELRGGGARSSSSSSGGAADAGPAAGAAAEEAQRGNGSAGEGGAAAAAAGSGADAGIGRQQQQQADQEPGGAAVAAAFAEQGEQQGAAAEGPMDDGEDDAASISSSSSSSSSSGSEYVDAEHGHSHKHGGGGYDEERHSKQACQDAFCPLHSGKSFLQISLTDDRQQSLVDFSALLAAGFKMLTITLSAEHVEARCTLLHEGHWHSLLAALESSDIEVLELNCQAARMTFRSSSLLHRLIEVPVRAAVQYVAENYSDTWQVKSWNGNTAADGVLEGSRGYALMRRSVIEAHQAQQLMSPPNGAAGTTGDEAAAA